MLGGLRSGRLGDILGRFSGYMSIGTELKRKLWLSLAYPILSMLVAITLFVFVNVVLVSKFEIDLPRLWNSLARAHHRHDHGVALLAGGLAGLADCGRS